MINCFYIQFFILYTVYILINHNHIACTSIVHVFLLFTLCTLNMLQTVTHFQPSWRETGKPVQQMYVQKVIQFIYTKLKQNAINTKSISDFKKKT